MSNDKLTNTQQAFIDDFAAMVVHWGMPITSARLYAYLLLVRSPVSLDEFAEALGISKSNASSAARELEGTGIARRLTERGSKRIRYEVSADPGLALRRHTGLLGQMAELITSRIDGLATGADRERLLELADFHRALKQAMEIVIEARRPHSP